VSEHARTLSVQPHLAACVILVSLLGVSACGESSDGVAVRIGHSAITKASVAHWMSALAGGRDQIKPNDRALRTRALELLISSTWLIGETAQRGLRTSQQEVTRSLTERQKASFPGGAREYHDFLKAAGQSLADAELQARAQLAAAKLRALALKRAGAVTSAQVVAYYRQHRSRYTTPERRVVQITNRKTLAAAQRLIGEVRRGRGLISRAQHQVGEGWVTVSASSSRRNALEKAIYAARPNVLTGPVKATGVYDILRVQRVIPSTTQTLARMRGVILGKLLDRRRDAALARFVKAWRSKWAARTDCRPGYVVPGCRRYGGPSGLREPSLQLG
jgi:foldase protein PrsA